MSDIPIVAENTHPTDADLKLNGSAGCGKSTQSILRLIEEMERRNLEYTDVTVCTYRNSLAKEIVGKLKEKSVVPDSVRYSDTYVGTIHGICRRLIQQSDEVDIDIDNLVSHTHKQQFCEQHGKRFYSDSHEPSAGEVFFDLLSYMRSNKLTPDTLPDAKLDLFNDEWEVSFGELLGDWVVFKTEYGNGRLWEFDEMLTEVRDAGLVPPNEFLIIDETHDIYPLLADIVYTWVDATESDPSKTVVVAGDPFQVINRYQGATPEYYENIELEELVLDTTFRCPEQVWEYAESVLYKEFDELNGVTADSDNGVVREVTAPRFYSNYHSREWQMDSGKWTPEAFLTEFGEDTMYLTRTQTQLRAITSQLLTSGYIYAGQTEQSWTENKHRLHIHNALQRIENNQPTASNELVELTKILPDEYLTDDQNTVINRLYTETGYIVPPDELDRFYTPEFLDFEFTYYLDELLDKTTLPDAEAEILYRAFRRNESAVPVDEISVQVRTIHEAKGMEAETVVLYDGITEKIQDSMEDDDGAKKNECRTWFVAASRSSQNLLIVRDAFPSFETSPYLLTP